MHQPVDFHDRVMFDIRQLRDEREAKERALAERPKLSFRADYEVWDIDLGYWRECTFFLFAPDMIEAKRLAVLYCRDTNGQPLDFHNMRVANA